MLGEDECHEVICNQEKSHVHSFLRRLARSNILRPEGFENWYLEAKTLIK